ncbi:hypothetical protein EV401DRAFT_2194714 [Pisolithus croceorrhizus]|nr:hypothetical protein EV401DRAFT_2194714 [Pisolithus croceorrhizus]
MDNQRRMLNSSHQRILEEKVDRVREDEILRHVFADLRKHKGIEQSVDTDRTGEGSSFPVSLLLLSIETFITGSIPVWSSGKFASPYARFEDWILCSKRYSMSMKFVHSEDWVHCDASAGNILRVGPTGKLVNMQDIWTPTPAPSSESDLSRLYLFCYRTFCGGGADVVRFTETCASWMKTCNTEEAPEMLILGKKTRVSVESPDYRDNQVGYRKRLVSDVREVSSEDEIDHHTRLARWHPKWLGALAEAWDMAKNASDSAAPKPGFRISLYRLWTPPVDVTLSDALRLDFGFQHVIIPFPSNINDRIRRLGTFGKFLGAEFPSQRNSQARCNTNEH